MDERQLIWPTAAAFVLKNATVWCYGLVMERSSHFEFVVAYNKSKFSKDLSFSGFHGFLKDPRLQLFALLFPCTVIGNEFKSVD